MLDSRRERCMMDKVLLNKDETDSIRKLKMANDLFEFAFKVKLHQLKLENPKMDDKSAILHTMRLLSRNS
jgi:hypothetical protein